MFRHSFGRAWIRAGGDLVSLQHQLGHADIGTTQRYAKLEKQELSAKHKQFSLFNQMQAAELENGGNGKKDTASDVLGNYGKKGENDRKKETEEVEK